jgi:hypothetical protein
VSKYKELGIALKAYRVASNEEISEVALATELSEDQLRQIEDGTLQPQPEQIEILARHFTLREQEAQRLLELAGYNEFDYDVDLSTDFDLKNLEDLKVNEVNVLVNPIFYTDTINVVSNQFGVVLSFVQSSGPEGKPIVVSRVGMSHVHAKSVIKVLTEAMRKSQKKTDQSSE